jgi:hypothetical protein
MRISKWKMACAILGVCSAGLASAQIVTAADYDAYYAQAADQPASPSDAAPKDAPPPPAPMGMGDMAAAAVPADAGCGCAGNAASDSCGCPTCCNSHCGWNRCCALDCGDQEPVRLFDDICGLECRGVKVYGWISGGFTANEYNPTDNYNGPVTFNDRADEGQLNQLYGIIERAVDNEGCGWGFGYRTDLLYGTDHRFTMARGLELEQDLSDRWNSGRFYGLALPQAYADFAYNDTTLRVGHFYTILGYEVAPAANNFFYSHSYAFQYAEPITHTGALAMQKWNDRLSFSAGVHKGWDNFDEAPGQDQTSFLGGVTLTSEDGKSSLAFALTTGDEPGATGFDNRTMYSLVYSRKMACDRLTYVFQHDAGVQNDGVVVVGGPVQDAEWYGINQYLLYQINCCWSTGVRFEWFRDDDGARVAGIGDGNAIAGGSFPGNFYEATWGANWRPNPNVVIRPELRYDWFDGTGTPYNDGTRDHQLTAAVDAIIQW